MGPVLLTHFACALALALLLSCGEATRLTTNDYLVELGNSSQGEGGLRLSFTSKDCDDMRVLRQGSVLAAAKCKNGELKLDAVLHREYVLETSRYVRLRSGQGGLRTCSRPVFVGENAMCGAGLFSQKDRDCTPQTSRSIAGDELSKTNLAPPSDRAFGLEFEFVGRKKSRWFFEDSGPSGLRAQVNLLGKCGMSMMSGGGGNCSSTLDCGTDQFCHKSKRCRHRRHCKNAEVVEGQCPPQMLWQWETDSSVKPLTYQQSLSAGGGMSETSGVAFELVSPPPPNALSGAAGYRSFTEVLATLRHVGIQAGPSQGMHVHVNVVGAAQGKRLSVKGITSVWTAWAMYQHAINEMLSPGRPGNQYARPLYIGNCHKWPRSVSHNPCKMVRHFFQKIYEASFTRLWSVPFPQGASAMLCNDVMRLPGLSNYPCNERYPMQRYFQVNMVPLRKYGTLEFRAHSGTYDHERIARWVQFLIAFVEHFGGEGTASTKQFFDAPSWEAGYQRLATVQRSATIEDLFKELDGKIDSGTANFYMTRAWEKGNRTCQKSWSSTETDLACRNAKLQTWHTCCCAGSSCKWFDSQLTSGNCPQVRYQDDQPKCITRTVACFMDPSCSQLKESNSCAKRPQETDFFRGGFC